MSDGRSAGFLVLAVHTAVRAELLDLQPIRVVPPVLAGDVVAVLAFLARQGDLGADIGGGHCSCLFLVAGARTVGWVSPSALVCRPSAVVVHGSRTAG